MNTAVILSSVTVIILAPCLVQALDNGVAPTPPMGWLSWTRFGCTIDCENNPSGCINEQLYTTMADRLVSDGYIDLGYVFINIDDCWSEMERDNFTKKLVADKKRFPHGIKWLSDYMHQRGLKLGIYADYGTRTCEGYPGSLGYLELDAQTFASWDVDSVKFDACNSDPQSAKTGYPEFGRYLNKTGKAIVYDCEWPAKEFGSNISSNYSAVAASCNLFRNFDDIQDSYDSVKSIINHYAENKDHFLEVSGPGNFNDPDVIIVGDFGLSYQQQRLQLGMWAIFAAPLYMSNDLRWIDPESVALLQNKMLVSINQDPLGLSGMPVFKNGDIQIWLRRLFDGRYAVAAINLAEGGSPISLSKTLFELGVISPKDVVFNAIDVFGQFSFGIFGLNDEIKFAVNATGIQLTLFVPLQFQDAQASIQY